MGLVFQEEKVQPIKRAATLTQLLELTKRAWLVTIRNPLSFQARAGQTVVLGVFIGLIYLRIGNDQSSISDREGSLFFLTVLQIMANLQGVLLTYKPSFDF